MLMHTHWNCEGVCWRNNFYIKRTFWDEYRAWLHWLMELKGTNLILSSVRELRLVESCWMRDRRTAWCSGQGCWLNTCWESMVSHTYSTRFRSAADKACMKRKEITASSQEKTWRGLIQYCVIVKDDHIYRKTIAKDHISCHVNRENKYLTVSVQFHLIMVILYNH